jgi:hypothetical protein
MFTSLSQLISVHIETIESDGKSIEICEIHLKELKSGVSYFIHHLNKSKEESPSEFNMLVAAPVDIEDEDELLELNNLTKRSSVDSIIGKTILWPMSDVKCLGELKPTSKVAVGEIVGLSPLVGDRRLTLIFAKVEKCKLKIC